ncbi:MAG: helix-turn-helix domain-containing protein [Luteolibacter sp.]
MIRNDSDEGIGKLLREAREAAGYTVEDVVYKAHLPKSVVEALEAEDFSVFSSPTYAKSFLTQYSEFLNVDAHLWLGALQPNSFVQTEGLHTIFEEKHPTSRIEPVRQRREAAANAGNGLFSVALYLLFTVGLGYAAWEGYKYFEEQGARLEPTSGDPYLEKILIGTAKKETPSPAPKQEKIPDSIPAPEPIVVKTHDDLPPPVPRAIIVRD